MAICVQPFPVVERSILKPSSLFPELSAHVRLICELEIAVAVRPLGALGTVAGAWTVMDTVAGELLLMPSLTLKANVVFPLQPMVGVKVTFGAVPLSTPLAGWLR